MIMIKLSKDFPANGHKLNQVSAIILVFPFPVIIFKLAVQVKRISH